LQTFDSNKALLLYKGVIPWAVSLRYHGKISQNICFHLKKKNIYIYLLPS